MQDEKKYPLLSRIRCPDDVKSFSGAELPSLCREIREVLIDTVRENGGHLASNLGVVELTLALYRSLNVGHDRIIWDVGHQAYVHKLLSGRLHDFSSLRLAGGMSGFPRRDESPYDVFGTGHGSTSLSAALGFAQSDRLNGNDAWTVAVVGDGAYTGGMIHEALNNCDSRLHLLVILNENEMSISRNTGRFAAMFSKLRNSGYYRRKAGFKRFLSHVPLIGAPLSSFFSKWKKNLKNKIYNSNYFENMGLFYLGPVDGNDYGAVAALIEEAKRLGTSCIIHVKTQKGRGFAPAEQNPGSFHSVAAVGQVAASPEERYSSVMGNALTELAKENRSVCAVTAAMTDGTGLSSFASEIKDRFFDVGMAEEHAVTFAAGLAAAGKRPFVAIYSTFLQRSYDQILHDVALQSLPVVFCIDRAGLNAADGATHHGIFDVSFLSSIPGVEIHTPYSFDDLRADLRRSLDAAGPVAIRYPNGHEKKETLRYFADPLRHPVALPAEMREAPRVWLAAHGRMVDTVLAAREALLREGVTAEVLMVTQIAPYSSLAKTVSAIVPAGTPLVCVEEEIRSGGFGMNLADAAKDVMDSPVYALGVDASFVRPSRGESVWQCAGVDPDSIVSFVKKIL